MRCNDTIDALIGRFAHSGGLPPKHSRILHRLLAADGGAVLGLTGSRAGGRTTTLAIGALVFAAHGDGDVLVVCQAPTSVRFLFRDLRGLAGRFGKDWVVRYDPSFACWPALINTVSRQRIVFCGREALLRAISRNNLAVFSLLQLRLVWLEDIYGISADERAKLVSAIEAWRENRIKTVFNYSSVREDDETERLVEALGVNPYILTWKDCPESWFNPKLLEALRKADKEGT